MGYYLHTNMKNLQSLALLLALPLVFIFGLYGVNFPPEGNYISKKIKTFNIRAYKDGVYINPQNTSLFYNFTPSKTDYPILKKMVVGKLMSYVYLIMSYFNTLNPIATFDTDDGKIQLVSSVKDDILTIKLINNKSAVPLELTLAYNDDDALSEIKNGDELLITNPSFAGAIGIINVKKNISVDKEQRLITAESNSQETGIIEIKLYQSQKDVLK